MEDTQEQHSLPELARIRTINHHLRAAIDRVTDGVLILEAEPLAAPGPRVVFVNQACRRITGFRAEDLLGQPIGLIYDKTKLHNFLVRLPAVAKTGKTYQMETLTTLADGSVKNLRWTVCAVCDPAGHAMNYMITILPEEGDRLAYPERAGDREVEASGDGGTLDSTQIHSSKMESLALVASGIAHDFNNVLTTVIANLSLAKLESSAESELRNHINDANAACENAKALCQQLLGFARGESPVKKDTDPGDLLNEAVRLATYGANVRCEVSIDDGLWSAEVDRTQITQVLSNLLINARQAMPNGGVIQASAENREVTPEDGLHVAPGKYVILTVRDRGCGISEAHLRRIFDPFFTTKKKGSGLGLATAYSLVQKHQGTILVRSKENVGTEFRIYLPASGQQSAEAQVVEATDDLVSGEGSILVVDDQESVLTVATAILRKLGYEALSASTGQEAVEIYRERLHSSRPVAAVILDMTLPGGLSGEDTLDELQRVDPEVCSIASSGYFDDDSHDRFTDRGFTGLLPKPYTAETLSQVLHGVMSRDQAARSSQVAHGDDTQNAHGGFVPSD